MVLKKLSYNQSIRLLKKYNIPIAKAKLVATFSEVKDFIKRYGYPIVLKVDPDKYLHKSDVKGVYLDIGSEKEASAYFKKLKKISENILVQKMYPGSYLIIGAKRDPTFGPVIMFGLGGIFTEILHDTSFRIAPLTLREALKMIKEIKGSKILSGARGFPKVNLNSLAKILLSVSSLMISHPEIKELDINPLIVNSKQNIAVDVRVIYE